MCIIANQVAKSNVQDINIGVAVLLRVTVHEKKVDKICVILSTLSKFEGSSHSRINYCELQMNRISC